MTRKKQELQRHPEIVEEITETQALEELDNDLKEDDYQDIETQADEENSEPENVDSECENEPDSDLEPDNEGADSGESQGEIIGTPIKNETDERLEMEINKAFTDDNPELQRHPHADDFEQQELEEMIEDLEKSSETQAVLNAAFENLDKDLDEDSYAHEENTADIVNEENTPAGVNEETSDTETPETDNEETANSENAENNDNSEVVAETTEEKRLLKRKSDYVNQRIQLEEKNIVLLTEAEKFERLVSTMNSEPFIELKNLVKEGLKTYVDRDDDKEAQKKFNNFKAICQMQNLLIEYKKLAFENRQNITVNENEIEKLIDKIDEIDSKLHNFQKKLDFNNPADADVETENHSTLEEKIEAGSELIGEDEIPF